METATSQVKVEWLRLNAEQAHTAWDAGIERFDKISALADAGTKGAGLTMRPLVSHEMLEVLVAYRADLIDDVIGTARTKLTQAVRVATISGEGMPQVAQRIEQLLPSPKGFGTLGNRAEVITRTEFGRVFNTAHDERFSQMQDSRAKAGMEPLRKRWVHNYGIRQRDNHAAMSGQICDANGWFTIPGSGEKCRYPHDATLSAKESANCRCCIVTVFPEVETLRRRQAAA